MGRVAFLQNIYEKAEKAYYFQLHISINRDKMKA